MRPAAIAYVAAAVVLTGAIEYVAFLPRFSGTPEFFVIAAAPSILLAAVAIEWARREELLREWLTPRWGDPSSGLLSAILLVVSAWGFYRLVAPRGSPREIWWVTLYGQFGNPKTLEAHGFEVAAGILVAVVAEEITWRGMVTQLLADRFGSRNAWIWAAGLYALANVPTAWALRASGGPLDPVLVVGGFGAALVWGLLGRRFGRLTAGVISHAMFDWALIMMFPLWGPR
jgi:membrane protease YdiL (CAAX protease family)